MRTPKLSELPPAHAYWLEIDTGCQTLTLWKGSETVFSCQVSTAKAGIGQEEGSGKTPHGWHYVRAAIGGQAPANAVFRGRRWTGEVYTATLGQQHPERDWILSRILWLCGLEPGFNRGGRVDSQRRYIYLHGTPESEPMGQARSHGCIRLRRDDLCYVFDHAPPGTPVWLHG
ncbi:L,D-transpeptidase [Vreelandella massiliensis]|uniref:L,D-transpeptidase n=1 Tax=Vreelandella massiliensis TaxID=1816686 RepID=UPI00096A8900|nr:L,D-transpeptidase [Halomonas massiliensis]MYL24583.1 L,D-transpeptidase family protein [Halomonas alkaliantarctica]